MDIKDATTFSNSNNISSSPVDLFIKWYNLFWTDNSYQEAYWLPLGKPLAVRFDSLLSNHHAFRDCKIFPTPHALMAPFCTFFQI